MRLVRKLRKETGERFGAVKRVADQLGYGTQSRCGPGCTRLMSMRVSGLA